MKPVTWRLRDIGGQLAPCACPLEEWGYPPTPILPAWYIREFARAPLPTGLRSLAPDLERVGDLGAFWQHASTSVSRADLRQLVDALKRAVPDEDFLVVPGPLVQDAINHWPLRVRTHNALPGPARY